ncbi:MAG: hypothetical protein IJ180_03045 [Bacteroidales bacterium]|nr:hypothetical protein [Bacteroidales bacterium]
MKKIVLLFAVVVIMTACGKSPEEKANALIKENMKKVLYHPESYDPAETIIDSAFAPQDDPVIYDAIMEAYELAQEIESINSKIKSAKTTMSIYSSPYDTYSKHSYNEAKKDYDKYSELRAKLEKKGEQIKKNNDELGRQLEKQGKKFIGFKAVHTYRAKNNRGDITFGKAYYLFDKDIKKIIKTYDMESDDYKIYEMSLKAIELKNL